MASALADPRSQILLHQLGDLPAVGHLPQLAGVAVGKRPFNATRAKGRALQAAPPALPPAPIAPPTASSESSSLMPPSRPSMAAASDSRSAPVSAEDLSARLQSLLSANAARMTAAAADVSAKFAETAAASPAIAEGPVAPIGPPSSSDRLPAPGPLRVVEPSAPGPVAGGPPVSGATAVTPGDRIAQPQPLRVAPRDSPMQISTPSVRGSPMQIDTPPPEPVAPASSGTGGFTRVSEPATPVFAQPTGVQPAGSIVPEDPRATVGPTRNALPKRRTDPLDRPTGPATGGRTTRKGRPRAPSFDMSTGRAREMQEQENRDRNYARHVEQYESLRGDYHGLAHMLHQAMTTHRDTHGHLAQPITDRMNEIDAIGRGLLRGYVLV